MTFFELHLSGCQPSIKGRSDHKYFFKNIEILISEESPYFLHYPCDNLGPRGVSFFDAMSEKVVNYCQGGIPPKKFVQWEHLQK